MNGILHVHNGDVVRMKLEESGVPGDHVVWADALHDGPLLPIDAPPERRRALRAASFGAAAGRARKAEIREMLERWDRDLGRWAEYDEVVLWLEHDLFDQLILARHLAYFAEAAPEALSLVCVGEWPGRPAFKGLGDLSPDQLAPLLGTRQRVTQRQLELGRDIWAALATGGPAAVEALARDESLALLPFMRAALHRFMEELPDVEAGLGRTERAVLEAVAEGIVDPVPLFRRVQQRDDVFFIGDLSLWHVIRMLAAGSRPLLSLAPAAGGPAPFGPAELTHTGREVLAGRADRVRECGIDRWWGGVHLGGHTVPWRWDHQAQRVVRTAEADNASALPD
jgi:hypothetical protein